MLLKRCCFALRNSQSCSVIQALVVFLFKLRTGNFNKKLPFILQLKNEHDVSDYSTRIMKSFEKDVLPHRSGLVFLKRDILILDHTTDKSKKLFDIDDQFFFNL